jgi:hypothetical protein
MTSVAALNPLAEVVTKPAANPKSYAIKDQRKLTAKQPLAA